MQGEPVVAEPVAVDAAGKKLVRARVARLFAEGQTNIEAASTSRRRRSVRAATAGGAA